MFDFFGDKPKRSRRAPDRRAGPRQGPYVRKQPRTRIQTGPRRGQWRTKRADAGKPRARRMGLFGW